MYESFYNFCNQEHLKQFKKDIKIFRLLSEKSLESLALFCLKNNWNFKGLSDELEKIKE